MNKNNRDALLSDTASRAARYLDSLQARSVAPDCDAVERLSNSLEGSLPETGAAPEEVLAFLDDFGSPATIASAGGRYFGFVTGGTLPASLAANWMAGAWDQNSFSHISSPAVAQFESTALHWVKQALHLPAEAEGAIVTGATLANFTGLAAARHDLLRRCGWDVESKGLFGAPEITVVVGAEAHASLYKVLAMLGLGRDRVVKVPVDGEGRMRDDALPSIEGPTIICLQAGNVNSGAFDPAARILPWAKGSQAWVHVDGAFGLWAAAAPGLSHLMAGYGLADSWATDAHKWLNVPYDSGIALVRDREAMHNAMAVSADYLMLGQQRDAIDFTPDCSRRARALEIWAALKSLGRHGLAEMIERNCQQAQRFGEGLRQAGAEVLNDVVLNQVVVAFGDDATTDAVVKSVQDSGVCWCGGTKWRGRAAMRISVSSWATTDEDVERSLEAIEMAWRQARS